MFQNAVRMLSSFRGGLREVPAPQRPLRGQATESVAIPIDGDTKDADREDLFRHHIQMGRGDSESQTPLLGDDAVHVVLDVDVDEEQRAQRPARSNQILEHGAHLTTVLYLCFLIGLCVLSNSMVSRWCFCLSVHRVSRVFLPYQCLVVFAAVLYMLCTGQLFALLIVVFMTVVLVVEYPRPHTAVWKWGIAYCVVVRFVCTPLTLEMWCEVAHLMECIAGHRSENCDPVDLFLHVHDSQ